MLSLIVSSLFVTVHISGIMDHLFDDIEGDAMGAGLALKFKTVFVKFAGDVVVLGNSVTVMQAILDQIAP